MSCLCKKQGNGRGGFTCVTSNNLTYVPSYHGCWHSEITPRSPWVCLVFTGTCLQLDSCHCPLHILSSWRCFRIPSERQPRMWTGVFFFFLIRLLVHVGHSRIETAGARRRDLSRLCVLLGRTVAFPFISCACSLQLSDALFLPAAALPGVYPRSC